MHRISSLAAAYRPLFEEVWGTGSFDIKFPRDTEKICDTPGGAAVFDGSTTPIPLSPEDRTRANTVYDRWAQSIDSFEQSVQVSAFSSKFDAFLAGKYKLTADERAGLKLFDGKGNCNSCHLDGRGTTLKSGQTDTSTAAMVNPLFTCFGSANEGLPLNPTRCLLLSDEAGFLRVHWKSLRFRLQRFGIRHIPQKRFGSAPNPNSAWTQFAPTTDGQMQVTIGAQCGHDTSAMPHHRSARSILPERILSQRLHQEPEATSPLLQHARQVKYNVTSGHCPPGTTEKVDCWPMPEVPNNIDMTTGNLGLTDKEENQIVAFLETLTDGFTRPTQTGIPSRVVA